LPNWLLNIIPLKFTKNDVQCLMSRCSLSERTKRSDAGHQCVIVLSDMTKQRQENRMQRTFHHVFYQHEENFSTIILPYSCIRTRHAIGHGDSIKEAEINTAYQNTKYDSLYQPAKRTV